MADKFALDRIHPNPWQVREVNAEAVKEMALDIAANGLLQPPIGRIKKGTKDAGEIELAFGHHRLAAYRWLHDLRTNSDIKGDFSTMPVVLQTLTNETMAILAWAENEKRRDVTPIERARALKKRMEDFGWSNRMAGEALGMEHSSVANILRLLELPENLQEALGDGRLSERQAMALLPLFDLPEHVEPYYSFEKKSKIIDGALEGESSDLIRTRVTTYIEHNSIDLAGAPFMLNMEFTEGKGTHGEIHWGTCAGCDKRLASRNRCFQRDCYAAKTETTQYEYLATASAKTGFGVLDPEKGGNPTYIYPEKLEAIKAAKCPNLVLTWTDDDRRGIKGFPHARLVCEKRNQSCTCIKGLAINPQGTSDGAGIKPAPTGGEDEPDPDGVIMQELDAEGFGGKPDVDVTDKDGYRTTMTYVPTPASGPTAQELEERARQARKAKADVGKRFDEVRELVVGRLVDALVNDRPGVFYLLAHSYSYPKPEQLRYIDELYQRIAYDLARQYVMPANSESVLEMIGTVNRKLEALELEPISLEKTLVEVLA